MAKLVKLKPGQEIVFLPYNPKKDQPETEEEALDRMVNDLLDEVEELLVDHESVVIRLVNEEDK